MSTSQFQIAEPAPAVPSSHLEYRRFGPPGTGKSTSVGRDVGHAVEKFGSAAVLVASYSKAAAVEIAAKCPTIEPDHVGTLHAMGYRVIGRPRVVDAKALVDWNEHSPSMMVKSGSRADMDDPLGERGEGLARGDELLAEYELLRARMKPREMWPASVVAFARRWEDWKTENDLVDFGDMIERALEYPVAPGNPTVGFFDECQDMSRLEWALVRSWARAMDYVVAVGDDDQAIYEWRGASAEAFLNPPLPDEQVRVLAQSYRVPEAVHSLATKWIGQVRGRQPKPYRPRLEPDGSVAKGAVVRVDYRLREREEIVDLVGRYAASGRTVAILASCSYMLSGVASELRRQGVPFHNPWRKSRGDWNPLTPGRGVSTADRLLAWLAPSRRADGSAWTLEELRRWSEIVSSGGMLARGAKTEMGRVDEMSYSDLVRWVPSETLAAGAAGDLNYLLRHVTPAKIKAAEFPARVIARRGPAALESKPKVIVSTIHGAKGGEADVVILAPDLSNAGAEEWDRGEASIRRLFYVAATRAREELVILEPNNGRMAVEL